MKKEMLDAARMRPLTELRGDAEATASTGPRWSTTRAAWASWRG
jgi:hypothetical protein